MIDAVDIGKLGKLYRKWVSFQGEFNVEKLYKSIQHEYTVARKGIIKVTPGLLTEIRSELNYVGRIRNSLKCAS